MTQDGKFKRLVRARMRATGENYLAALTAIRPGLKRKPRRPRSHRDWVEMLATSERSRRAYELLAALPEDECRDASLGGLRHESWRVRRHCCRLLDHLTLTDETIAAMTALLDDPYPRVRQAALHTLVCEGCKPEKCDVDVRGLLESMREDPSADVRRAVMTALWQFDDEWATALARERAETDGSRRVREVAEVVLRGQVRKNAGDAARKALPAELQAKMAKHAGKWVAVADGRIIGANRFAGQVRRAAKGTGHSDAVMCWVPPGV